MTKLNQIIAIEKTARVKAADALTRVHHQLQRSDSLFGQIRRYAPMNDDGVRYPNEDKVLETTVGEQVRSFFADYARGLDLTFTKEVANMQAVGDITLPDGSRIEDVPVTYLLHLEKKLGDIRTFIKKMPVLDSGTKWTWSAGNECYEAVPVDTFKTQKTYRNHVLSEATKEHPAQVQVYSEDVPIGTWTTTRLSGAISPAERDEMLDKVEALIESVKKAREAANNIEVVDRRIGEDLLISIFGDLR